MSVGGLPSFSLGWVCCWAFEAGNYLDSSESSICAWIDKYRVAQVVGIRKTVRWKGLDDLIFSLCTDLVYHPFACYRLLGSTM